MRKSQSSNLLTESGIVIDVSLAHLNAPAEMVFIVSGILKLPDFDGMQQMIWVISLLSSTPSTSTKFVFSKISISFRSLHSGNGFPPKETTDLGILNDGKLHCPNALFPMCSTESGIAIGSNSSHLQNASSQMDLTDLESGLTPNTNTQKARSLMHSTPSRTTADLMESAMSSHGVHSPFEVSIEPRTVSSWMRELNTHSVLQRGFSTSSFSQLLPE